jgi:hypothetical protein
VPVTSPFPFSKHPSRPGPIRIRPLFFPRNGLLNHARTVSTSIKPRTSGFSPMTSRG